MGWMAFVALVTAHVPALADSGAAANGRAESAAQLGSAAQGKKLLELVDRLVERAHRATGTASSTLKARKPERYAAAMLQVEHELVNLLDYVGSATHLPREEREVALGRLRALISQLAWNYNSVLTEMRARQETNRPGSTGRTVAQPERHPNGPRDLYVPSFHSDRSFSRAERRRLYEQLRDEHRQQHPDEKRPYFSLNRQSLKEIKHGELLEWVAMPGGQLRLTRNAKHVVTAGGHDVASAGSLKIFWDQEALKEGKRVPALVLVSNWSGTYQPDMSSVHRTMVRRLRHLGISVDRIVLVPNMPTESKTFEAMLGARGFPKAKTRSEGRKLMRSVQERTGRERAAWERILGSHAGRSSSGHARSAGRRAGR
jgi:hypothetical protein